MTAEQTHEAITPELKRAARRVRLDEFFQLRFANPLIDDREKESLQLGAGIISEELKKMGITFNIKAEVQGTLNPWKRGARRVLTQIPLGVYLQARESELAGSLAGAQKELRVLESRSLLDPDLDMVGEYAFNLQRDLDLTRAVISGIGTGGR